MLRTAAQRAVAPALRVLQDEQAAESPLRRSQQPVRQDEVSALRRREHPVRPDGLVRASALRVIAPELACPRSLVREGPASSSAEAVASVARRTVASAPAQRAREASRGSSAAAQERRASSVRRSPLGREETTAAAARGRRRVPGAWRVPGLARESEPPQARQEQVGDRRPAALARVWSPAPDVAEPRPLDSQSPPSPPTGSAAGPTDPRRVPVPRRSAAQYPPDQQAQAVSLPLGQGVGPAPVPVWRLRRAAEAEAEPRAPHPDSEPKQAPSAAQLALRVARERRSLA
jgi:hypothetical protein